FEFLKGIADQATDGNEVHLSDVRFQPIASDDVAAFVAKYAVAAPIDGIVEIAGPERFAMYEVIARYLRHANDPRKVVANGKPAYYGGEISHRALVPAGQAELGAISFEKWWSNQLQKV
ncbi:MAG: NmrA family transcriptional regulator, partial [Mucilaginibacter sp.]